MKTRNLKLFIAVACSLVTLNAPSARASNNAAIAGPNRPYEAWSTGKVKVVNPDRVTVPSIHSNTDVRVETTTGTQQTLKLSSPIGKL